MEYYNAPKAIASGQDGPSRASVFPMSPEGDSQPVIRLDRAKVKNMSPFGVHTIINSVVKW